MTQQNKATVLVIDDDEVFLEFLREYCTTGGYDVHASNTAADGLNCFRQIGHDVIILDQNLPDASGLDLAEKIIDIDPNAVVLVVTGYATIESSIYAQTMGVEDYLVKPLNLDRLDFVMRRGLSRRQLGLKNQELQFAVGQSLKYGQLVGNSPAMRQVFMEIVRGAKTTDTILIQGPTGCGKELTARAIHELSPRRKKPFIAVNCSSIPESLLESELFGYVKGAFTGANADKPGFFQTAEGGSLLLDEIQSASISVQTSLLRVLDRKEILPVGGRNPIPVDVRVIATSNADLEALAAKEKFRHDLYYRVSSRTIHMPSLKDRKEDIPLLADCFLDEHSKSQSDVGRKTFSPRLTEAMMWYDWPGNVRELKNFVLQSASDSPRKIIRPADIPLKYKKIFSGDESSLETLDEVEKKHILKTLAALENNKAEAAKRLGVSRSYLYKLLQKHQIQLPD